MVSNMSSKSSHPPHSRRSHVLNLSKKRKKNMTRSIRVGHKLTSSAGSPVSRYEQRLFQADSRMREVMEMKKLPCYTLIIQLFYIRKPKSRHSKCMHHHNFILIFHTFNIYSLVLNSTCCKICDNDRLYGDALYLLHDIYIIFLNLNIAIKLSVKLIEVNRIDHSIISSLEFSKMNVVLSVLQCKLLLIYKRQLNALQKSSSDGR